MFQWNVDVEYSFVTTVEAPHVRMVIVKEIYEFKSSFVKVELIFISFNFWIFNFFIIFSFKIKYKIVLSTVNKLKWAAEATMSIALLPQLVITKLARMLKERDQNLDQEKKIDIEMTAKKVILHEYRFWKR